MFLTADPSVVGAGLVPALYRAPTRDATTRRKGAGDRDEL